jgi:integrase/recombinase XerD
MFRYSDWSVDGTKILSRRELGAVLADLATRCERSRQARLNRVIFRLACCGGLRASEIAHLQLADVHTSETRPHLVVRGAIAKGQKPRAIPLWWDGATLSDLTAWKAERVEQTTNLRQPFVACQKPSRLGRALSRHTIRRRFLTACKCLGRDRLATLTIHHGRHTFISHALAGRRSLAEVRMAAGHSNLITTSVYLHVAVDDDEQVGSLFARA